MLWLGVAICGSLGVATTSAAATSSRASALAGSLPPLVAPLAPPGMHGSTRSRKALQIAATQTVTVGTLPTGVAATDAHAYVANAQTNNVSVVDLATDAVLAVPVGAFPVAVALNAGGSQAYVTNFGDGTLSIIDTATNTVTHTVTVGSKPDGVIRIGGSVYVANLLSHSISVVDPTAGTVSATITLTGAQPPAPSGLATNSGATRLYVNDARNGATVVIDPAGPSVLGSVNVQSFPAYIAVAGSTGYVANAGSNSVSVLNLAATPPTVIAPSVGVGSHPYGVAALPALGEVFVTNSGSGSLEVLDTGTNAPVGPSVQVGNTPDAIALTPDGTTALVTNEGDNTLSVLHVDQPPVNTVPGAQQMAANDVSSAHNKLVFSSANGNPISSTDGDAGSAPVKVSLSVASGILTLSGTSGLTFTSGANGSSAMTFTGTLADVNAALAGASYEPATGFQGTDTLTLTVNDQGSSGIGKPQSMTSTVSIGVLNRAPLAGNVSFSGAVGNTTFGVGTSPPAPSTHTTGTVLSNSSDPNGDSISAQPGTITTTNGGSVTVSADGTFTYKPPAGFTGGNDTFTFTVSDGHLTATATATIAVANRVWYVDASVPSSGNGESFSPFKALSSVTGPGGPTGSGDYIFVYGNASPYAGGIALKGSQTLVGQSVGLNVGGQQIVTASGANPTITNAAGSGITLAEGDTVEGITVASTSGVGVSANGVNSFTLAPSDSITGANGGLSVTGGSGAIADGARITTSGGHALSVQNRTGGTLAVTGNVQDTGQGISLSSNTGATVNLTGGVSASTGANPAFSATGGGRVSVAASLSNSLATTTGPALNVASTTIGSPGLNFVSISAGTVTTGPARGISLTSTGTTAGLQVSGTGTTAGSGGTIQHTTSSGSITPGASDGGIYLSNTADVSLADMNVASNHANGVYGTAVTNLALSHDSISGNGVSQSADDSGLRVDGLSGVATIDHTSATTSAENNAGITGAATTGLMLTVTNSTFGPKGAPGGNDGLQVIAQGAPVTLVATNDTFTGNFADGLTVLGTGSGALAVTANNNTVTSNTGAGIDLGASPHVINPATFNVETNTLTGQQGNAINVANLGDGTWQGNVRSNTVGSATANSGSIAGSGINVVVEGSGTLTTSVALNNIKQIESLFGIAATADTGPSTLNLTLATNTVSMIQNTSFDGITVNSGALTGDTSTVCLNANANNSTAAGVTPTNGQSFDSVGMSWIQNIPGTTFKLQGYSGSGSDPVAVQSFMTTTNTLTGPTPADNAIAQPNPSFTPFAGTCSTTTVPPGRALGRSSHPHRTSPAVKSHHLRAHGTRGAHSRALRAGHGLHRSAQQTAAARRRLRLIARLLHASATGGGQSRYERR